MSIRRLDPDTNMSGLPLMVPADDGGYVDYDDHVAEVGRLRDTLIGTAAALAAAISLLERGGKAAKKAAASDKMFDLMLAHYRAALAGARAALAAPEEDET